MRITPEGGRSDVVLTEESPGRQSRPAEPRKGNARLSISVNLDIPADYRTREFVSVADAVHQPSVLSLVVQRRGQIAAIRWLAAMVVVVNFVVDLLYAAIDPRIKA